MKNKKITLLVLALLFSNLAQSGWWSTAFEQVSQKLSNLTTKQQVGAVVGAAAVAVAVYCVYSNWGKKKQEPSATVNPGLSKVQADSIDLIRAAADQQAKDAIEEGQAFRLRNMMEADDIALVAAEEQALAQRVVELESQAKGLSALSQAYANAAASGAMALSRVGIPTAPDGLLSVSACDDQTLNSSIGTDVEARVAAGMEHDDFMGMQDKKDTHLFVSPVSANSGNGLDLSGDLDISFSESDYDK